MLKVDYLEATAYMENTPVIFEFFKLLLQYVHSKEHQ